METSFSLGGGLVHVTIFRARSGLKLVSNEYFLREGRVKFRHDHCLEQGPCPSAWAEGLLAGLGEGSEVL